MIPNSLYNLNTFYRQRETTFTIFYLQLFDLLFFLSVTTTENIVYFYYITKYVLDKLMGTVMINISRAYDDSSLLIRLSDFHFLSIL